MVDMIVKGGWVMAPILLLSVAGLAVVIERLFALRRSKVLAPGVLEQVESYAGEEDAPVLLRECEASSCAYARLITECLKVRGMTHDQILETMHATGRTQVGRLERGLTLLEIVGNVSPLLGLLGTVLGMMTVFNAITSAGIGDPRVLSAGISQALITTVAGLCVAIPAVIAHSWLSNIVDGLAMEMQERGTIFVMRLLAGTTRPGKTFEI